MKKIEKRLKSKCDGLSLMVTVMIPDENVPVKGIVQISHGMAEHRKRYFPFMQFLTQNGYITVINDHRGHGGSVKSQDDLGYFYDKTGNYIIEDLHQVTQYIKKGYPDLPVYLFGHSMGSLVVRCYLKQYDDEIDKLIVCGSPSQNHLAGLGIALTKLIQIFTGDKHRSKLMQKLTFANIPRKSRKEKESLEQEKNSENNVEKYQIKTKESQKERKINKESQVSWISSNQENVEQYEKDNQCGFIFTLNGFQNLYKLVQNTYSDKGWEKKNLSLPIFFIAGDKDPIIGNLSKWMSAYEFLQNDIGYQNISHKLYKDKKHELLNEDIKEKVYVDILNWIEE